jgi:hypothetical protein
MIAHDPKRIFRDDHVKCLHAGLIAWVEIRGLVERLTINSDAALGVTALDMVSTNADDSLYEVRGVRRNKPEGLSDPRKRAGDEVALRDIRGWNE